MVYLEEFKEFEIVYVLKHGPALKIFLPQKNLDFLRIVKILINCHEAFTALISDFRDSQG